ncbi:MAG: kelch repeat-containing protein [Gemmatales bacterium]|nr:kelch repeat-containing protein [Gemmatales bacterium]
MDYPRARSVRYATITVWLSCCVVVSAQVGERLSQPANTWVKRSPLPDAPPSPRLGYEASWAYDRYAKVLIRWGGHNQGGGGEQHSETWTFDPVTARWTLKEPNDAPPGVCCAQQNVFDEAARRFVRFPAFSGSHGWQWFREIYLKNTSVWTYELARNHWRDMRPCPEPRLSPLRCASWDSEHEVIVVFGGEGNTEGTLVYDLYTNTWTWQRPPEQPAFRSGGNMTYDAAHRVHILFGSQFSNDPHTWAYDLVANRWIDLKPSTMPPTDRNDAVLTYDPINRVVIAVIKVSEGKGEEAKSRLETWAFDTGKRQWTKMNPPREPDPSGNRARLLTFLPDHGLAILENRTHPPHGPAEQQIWTYRYGDTPAQAARPTAPVLKVVTTQQSAILTWQNTAAEPPARWGIFRGEGPRPWEAKYQRIAEVPGNECRFEDRTVQKGQIYYYFVRAETQAGALAEGAVASNKGRTQPRIVEEVTVSVLGPQQVELNWAPPESAEDVIGYHVERAVVEVYSDDQLVRVRNSVAPLPTTAVAAVHRIGPFQRLTEKPLTATRFTDRVDLTKPIKIADPPLWERRFYKEEINPEGKPYPWAVYAYRVRAVNALGVESGPSPYFLTIPSAPQWVFSRERNGQCDLKWAKNPERGLRGYRVYRIDSRFGAPPVSRLTPEPIQEATFTDATAGKATRRYHIVAVDALGQEGIPSMPVWYEREWKSFYKPFTGEWHQ